LESEENEKSKFDLKSSILEMETEMEPLSWGFFFVEQFICREDGGLCYIVGRGDHFLNDMIGTDRLCDKGLGQDDEGQAGNAALRMK
jgi:hypothetical protein